MRPVRLAGIKINYYYYFRFEPGDVSRKKKRYFGRRNFYMTLDFPSQLVEISVKRERCQMCVALKSRKIDKWVTIAHLTSKGNFTLHR